MILSGRYKGIWVKAYVIQIEENTMGLRVILPQKWKVATIALGVPKQCIRAVSKAGEGNYTVPIEFIVDDSILYLGCTKQMRIKHLKVTVSRERAINACYLFFMHRGTWLTDSDPIPNDVIFCIIHGQGNMTSSQIDMIESSKKKFSLPTKSKNHFPKVGAK